MNYLHLTCGLTGTRLPVPQTGPAFAYSINMSRLDVYCDSMGALYVAQIQRTQTEAPVALIMGTMLIKRE